MTDATATPRSATANAKFSQLAQPGWPLARLAIQTIANPIPIRAGPNARLGLRSGSDSSAAVPNARTAAMASNQSAVAAWFSLRPIHQKMPRAIPRMKQLFRTMGPPSGLPYLRTRDHLTLKVATDGGASEL